MFFRDPKVMVVTGYFFASLWLMASTAFAFRSLVMPVPQPQAAVLGTSETDAGPDVFPHDLAVGEDPALRDPFSKGRVLGAVVAREASFDLSGLRLKAVILSLKNGIVLEDASGGVFFLSEGESVNGILVKAISATTASVEVNGNSVDLFVGGQR